MFTQTAKENDTLTVNVELVRDPDHFLSICSHVASSTFMKIPATFDIQSAENVTMDLPCWFKPNRFNSIAIWLLLFIERNIYVHYATFVRQFKSYTAFQDRWFSQPLEGTLMNFRYEIITYWTDFTKQIQKNATEALSQLYLELDEKACSEP